MAEERRIPNFYEIQRVTAGYDTYIVGRFCQPGLYVLGVMDPEDPKTWRGDVSDLVLCFALTPEEYGWLNTDREKLDDLARRLQREMPRSRFAAGVLEGTGRRTDLQETCRAMLKSDCLEEDTAFEAWKEAHPFQKMQQPNTPVNLARHELCSLQHDTASQRDRGELFQKEMERRQRTLANRLLEQDAFYVGMDKNSPGGVWPGLEYLSGDVHLFSTQENALNACEFYASRGIFEYEAQRVEQSQYAAFFQNCESLGVTAFRVDDGVEPVELKRSYLWPDREQSWLEEHNQTLRNAMLRSAELSGHMQKNQEKMSENLRRNLVGFLVTWRCRMLQELGDGLYYVPCALPGELYEEFQSDLVLSKRGMTQMKERMRRELRPSSAGAGPHFGGRVVSVEDPKHGRLPLRLITTERQERWLVAFTSQIQCQAFLDRQQNRDTMVVMTFDELYEQVEGLNGLVVDVLGLGVQLRPQEMAQCRTLRSQERATVELKPSDPPKTTPKTEEKPVEKAPDPPKSQPVPPQSEPKAQETPNSTVKKNNRPGFFRRLFRRKH